jgi:hypothetical protein
VKGHLQRLGGRVERNIAQEHRLPLVHIGGLGNRLLGSVLVLAIILLVSILLTGLVLVVLSILVLVFLLFAKCEKGRATCET